MIRLNFLPFKDQNIPTSIFRKLKIGEKEEGRIYQYFGEEDEKLLYEVEYEATEGFEEFKVSPLKDHYILAKKIYGQLIKSLPQHDFIIHKTSFSNKKIHFILEDHPKGKKCIWAEPYFLKSKGLWGLLIDYHFLSETPLENKERFTIDKEILIASGTLNSQGNSNTDFYLFKHQQLLKFTKKYVPIISSVLKLELSADFVLLDSSQLLSKTYIFGNGNSSTSSYMGLAKNIPLRNVNDNSKYYFIYKKDNRDVAISLLKGLRGETSPATFSGIEKLFHTKFTNEVVTGGPVDNFDDKTIENEIVKINALGKNIIPVIITNSKRDENDERLYYRLKHKFTSAGIPCQVVTKDLVRNEYSLKYSLSNIGLQIFAKAGGQPWKMKSANPEYLIIGIGQSYNIDRSDADNKIDKNITYSVLTDSSGLFKDIQVLGEGVEDESYYNQLINNLVKIINTSNYRKVSIHCPFRISKPKVLDKVVKLISDEIELSVLVINQKSDFFGFDYENNGLVPFESTYVKISSHEFLVWFEGLQYSNPKITKRFGNPLLITFWYTNKPTLYSDYKFKESLLQDCINLSGANWRGFKAKQLPVSVYYCQKISDFIKKFKQYDLAHIEISNLKPWFL